MFVRFYLNQELWKSWENLDLLFFHCSYDQTLWGMVSLLRFHFSLAASESLPVYHPLKRKERVLGTHFVNGTVSLKKEKKRFPLVWDTSKFHYGSFSENSFLYFFEVRFLHKTIRNKICSLSVCCWAPLLRYLLLVQEARKRFDKASLLYDQVCDFCNICSSVWNTYRYTPMCVEKDLWVHHHNHFKY